MENNLDQQESNSKKVSEEEIDLKEFISFLLRNKILIGAITFLSFVIAFTYSLTLKKVWEGQFQIVLNTDDNTKISSLNPSLSSLIDANRNTDNLNTQVQILQSPSVLMPIYDLVNKKNKKEFNSDLPFNKWRYNLDVELERGTSVLNISYRDTNKEIILPVLIKMSSIYQDYSGRAIRRGQNLTKEYLTNQIDLYRKKSTNSIKSAQNFAVDQDLIDSDLTFSSNNKDLNNDSESLDKDSYINEIFLGPNINIENIRVDAANQIRKIDIQIQKINELESKDYENLQYFGSSIPALSKEGLPQTLKNIEEELVFLRSQYTENDPSIIRLLEQRSLTAELLKSRAIKYLKVAKLEAEATMEAAMRPKGVLLKYKELIREAARDEATLISLENDLRLIELQKAKISEPWQLITKPTLLNNPVAPSKTAIASLGLIAGFFVGIFISLYKEKRSDKIFSVSQLEKLLEAQFIGRINKKDGLLDSKQIMFLKEYLKNHNTKKITFISLEKINKSYLEKLREFLINKTNLDAKINCFTAEYHLEEFNDKNTAIFFTSLKHSSLKEIQTLKNRFNLLNIYFQGIILLDE